MTSVTAATPMPRSKTVMAGWIVSSVLIALLLLDAGIKLVAAQAVIDASLELGWPADENTIHLLGLILALCTVLYAVPRTSILGAILLTGWMGGAIATHLRVGDPLFTHTLFGVYLGVALWGALWLRDPRLRALIPLAK